MIDQLLFFSQMKAQIVLCFAALLVSLVASRELSNNGVNFIKNEEGWRACAYKDAVGLWTIGYGHLITKNDGLCKPVPTTKCCISEQRGVQILTSDVKVGSSCISRIVKGVASLTDNQFSALTSWAFNVGCGAATSSTLVKKLNAGNKGDTCGELKKWVKGGGKVIRGLVNRRNRECQLFLKP